MRPLTYGSICSGIEAATAAWKPLGWHAAWFAEIEPFPCAVLAHHYPDVPNLGDISMGDFADRAMEIGSIDVLVGGTPCQAFSIAGKRRSLKDDRGNLALVFCRLVERLDPWCVLWENVPGVLSTDDNAFGYFLAGLVGAAVPLVPGNPTGRWPDAGLVRGPVRSAAWGILDAQYFGLAQRRRRVFVASLRADDWRCPAAILFEPYGMQRHPAAAGEEESSIAPCVTPGARRTSGNRSGEQLTVGTITAKYDDNCGRDLERDDMFVGFQANGSGSERAGPMTLAASDDNGSNQLVADTLKAHHGRNREDDTYIPEIAHALTAEGFDASEDGTGRGTPLVPVAFAWQDDGKQTSLGFDPRRDSTQTLSANQVPAIAFQQHGSDVGPMGTLRSGRGDVQSGVPFVINAAKSCATRDHARESDTARCLDGMGGFASSQGGTLIGDVAAFNIIGLGQQGRNHAYETDVSGCLQNKGLNPTGNEAGTVIAFQERGRADGPNLEHQADRSYSLNAPSGGGRRQEMNIATDMAVRRLMPVECERLQGFPDGHTDVPFRGKPAADGPRYRAIGNSKAVTVVRWLGRRIEWLFAQKEG